MLSSGWWSVDVDVVVSVQRATATSGCVASLSYRWVRAMELLLFRLLSLVPATVRATWSDARLIARSPYCGADMDVEVAVSAHCAPATTDCVSSLTWHWVRAMVLLLSRLAVLDVDSVDV